MGLLSPDSAKFGVNRCWYDVRSYINDAPTTPPSVRVGHVPYFTYDAQTHTVTYNPRTFGCVTHYEVREQLIEAWSKNINWLLLEQGNILRYYSGLGDKVEDPRMRKIRKLLALAGSSDPNEAAAALAMARNKMDEWELNHSEPENTPFFAKSMGRMPCGMKQQKATHRMIGMIVEHFDCRLIWQHGLRIDSAGAWVMIAHGSRSALEIADYVADYLSDEIERFWNTYRKEHGAKGRSAKHSYQLGLLYTVHERLKVDRPKPNQHALIRVGKLNDFVDMLHPDLTSMSEMSDIKDGAALRAGTSDGQNLHIRPGVNGAGNSHQPRGLEARLRRLGSGD